VQTLDPAGVGARTLGECLALQLAQLDPETPGRELAIAIATHHLQAVADKDLASLRRALGADEDSLQVALALVRSCHPRPGSAFEGAQPEFVSRTCSCDAPTRAGASSSTRVPYRGSG
jgi:RNA polymerase sigma-54 factor